MTRFLLALAFAAVVGATPSFAAPACTTASLHVYDVAGFSCSEGTELFSSFAFTDSGSENPLPTDSSITVSPLAGGLQFGAGFAAPSGQTLDAAITYTTVSATGFTTDTLSILGFGVSGNASIDVAESICVGAAFASNGTCPTAKIVSLNAFDNGSGMQPSATAAIPAGVTTLGVAKDISIIGGSGMSAANLSLVDNATPVSTATTPEPGTLALVGIGLLGLVRLSKRRS